VSSGITIIGFDDDHTGVEGRITVQNNLFEYLSRNWGGQGFFLQVLHGPSDVLLDHNTCLPSNAAIILDYSQKGDRFQFTNNITAKANGGFTTQVLNHFFTSWTVTGNAFVGDSASGMPPGNTFPATINQVAAGVGADVSLLPRTTMARLCRNLGMPDAAACSSEISESGALAPEEALR
jgi:hypothetical protein